MTAEVMMKEYKNMKKELTLTEFQLRQFQGVSEQDMIDSMLYSHPEGERVQTSTLSDKTANIAIKYRTAIERENDEWYEFLFHRYMFLKEELEFFEHAVSRLEEKHRSIITDLLDEDILRAIERKDNTQNAMIEAVKARIGGMADDGRRNDEGI